MSSGEDLIDNGLNAVLQIGTGGLVGYQDGKVGGGYSVDAFKEISGAAAAEEANELAREQFEQAQAQADKDRKNQLSQNRQRSLQASESAGAIRNRVNTSNNSSNTSSSSLGGDFDYLGL